MRRLFLRTVAYVGLYAEIFSATCRWISKRSRIPWKLFVTNSLVETGYRYPLTGLEELLAQARYNKLAVEEVHRQFYREQPETIQTCLRVNRKALAAVRGKREVIDGDWISGGRPAIPVFTRPQN